MSFLFKGRVQELSIQTSPKLLKALEQTYNAPVTAVQLHVELSHFKDEEDLVWQQCAEREEITLEGQDMTIHYNNIWAEYILAVSGEDLSHCRALAFDCPLNLTRPLELVFTSTDIELKCKTLRNLQFLRSRSAPYRVLHLLLPTYTRLQSITYL